ncbi:hypothetical protein Rctr71_086 [Virus Rctr71]|nr:hypothetical protein Rctr71_086 [Virus Rctr71]
MSSVGYIHSDLPVAIGNTTASSTYISRVQSFNVTKSKPSNPVYEMGRMTSVGPGATGGEQYSGSISWFPIGIALERALAEQAGAVNALDFISATPEDNAAAAGLQPLIIHTPYVGLQEPRVVSLEYTFQERADMSASAQLRGVNRLVTGSLPTMGAVPAIGSVATYKASQIAVTVGGTAAVRAMRAVVRVQYTVEEAYQLGQATPVGARVYRPVVTADIDFIASSSTAGDSELTEASPGAIGIAVNTNAITFTLAAMYTTNIADGGQINGFATKRLSYLSKGDATTGGFSVTVS